MKNLHYLLIFIVLLPVYSFTNNDYEKKKISNKLYSFSVPLNWEPNYPPGKSGDGFIPSERDASPYRLYYLSWNSPSRSLGDMISLYIESYKRLDNRPLSIKDIEDEEMSKMKQAEERGFLKILERKELSAKANQKRFIIKEISKEINVQKGESTVKHSRIYLLHKNGGIVHCVCIFVNEDLYLLPETQRIINDILDSFSTRVATRFNLETGQIKPAGIIGYSGKTTLKNKNNIFLHYRPTIFFSLSLPIVVNMLVVQQMYNFGAKPQGTNSRSS